MALTDSDKKWITENTTSVVIDVLEKVVIPQFTDLEERSSNKITNEIKASEKRLNNRIDGVEINLGRQIDNLAKTVAENHVNHEKRIVRLETRIG